MLVNNVTITARQLPMEIVVAYASNIPLQIRECSNSVISLFAAFEEYALVIGMSRRTVSWAVFWASRIDDFIGLGDSEGGSPNESHNISGS